MLKEVRFSESLLILLEIRFVWNNGGQLPPGGGDSHMKQTGMLIGNFEFNP